MSYESFLTCTCRQWIAQRLILSPFSDSPSLQFFNYLQHTYNVNNKTCMQSPPALHHQFISHPCKVFQHRIVKLCFHFWCFQMVHSPQIGPQSTQCLVRWVTLDCCSSIYVYVVKSSPNIEIKRTQVERQTSRIPASQQNSRVEKLSDLFVGQEQVTAGRMVHVQSS